MFDTGLPRRGVLAGLAGAAALPAGAQAQAQTPRTGGTLRISHSTRIAQLNPLQLSGPAEYPAVDMIYSGLTRLTPNMVPEPELCTAWEGSEGARRFTFRLRPGVTWHDGTPFTAEDVIATFRAILEPRTGSPARPVVNMISDITAPDPLTVVFDLSSANADFPVAVAHANARIVSAAALRQPLAQLDTRANGTGPFRLETYDSARMLRLVKNAAYYKPGRPYLDAVEMYLFPDLAAEAANYLSGAMDVMLEVQQADFRRIASAPNSNATRVASGRFLNVVMRFDQPPFNDPRVRQAFAMSVDRQMLVDLVLEGLGRVAADNPISPGYRFLVEHQAPAYNPQAARRLLAEAGHPRGLRIPLICSNRPAIRTQAGVAIRQLAAAGGFDIDVQTIPHDTFLANVWRRGNFYVGFWGMQATEDAAFTLLFTSDAAFEDTGWKNAEFDGLVARGRATLDEAERRSLYAQAQALIVRDRPYVIPFFQDVLTASRSHVRGWTANPIPRTFYTEDVWLDRA
jgi:peptide/nickel transport system substrate-binding protein